MLSSLPLLVLVLVHALVASFPRASAGAGAIVRPMDSIVGLVAIVMVFGIPMSAIIGAYWLKAKRLQLGSGDGAGAANRLAKLEAASAELKQRVEILETIVTSDPPAIRPRVLVEPAAHEEPAAAPAEEPDRVEKASRAP